MMKRPEGAFILFFSNFEAPTMAAAKLLPSIVERAADVCF